MVWRLALVSAALSEFAQVLDMAHHEVGWWESREARTRLRG